jgi:hypothetical protein
MREPMTQLAGVVRLLKTEHERLTKQIQGISAALLAFGAEYGKANGGRGKISPAGRARIAEAQRQRWAKLKGKTGQTKSAATPKRRRMSAAARRKIAAAQRLRWSKVRASQKKAA